MIVLAGDTHGSMDIAKLNSDNFPEGKKLTKDDYVIILGDFGLLWKNEEDATERHYILGHDVNEKYCH